VRAPLELVVRGELVTAQRGVATVAPCSRPCWRSARSAPLLRDLMRAPGEVAMALDAGVAANGSLPAALASADLAT